MTLLPTILGEKIVHFAQLHMAAESGITIPCGMFAVRLFRKDDKFCVCQIITDGVNSTIPFKVYKRDKVVKPKNSFTDKKLVSEAKDESLF